MVITEAPDVKFTDFLLSYICLVVLSDHDELIYIEKSQVTFENSRIEHVSHMQGIHVQQSTVSMQNVTFYNFTDCSQVLFLEDSPSVYLDKVVMDLLTSTSCIISEKRSNITVTGGLFSRSDSN